MLEAPQYVDMAVKQAVHKVQAPSMPFAWSLNPYRGCSHGCAFCYARSTHSFLGFAADDTFRKHVMVKAAIPEALERQLETKLRACGGNLERLSTSFGTLAIGTATDPYQSIEAKREITRSCLEVLAKYQIWTTITTRSPLILRDVDILKRMRLESVQLSIHTLDGDIWRAFEPATPAPKTRLATVRKLAEHKLPVGVFLAPILPYISDGEAQMHSVIEQAVAHGAHFVMPSILRLAPEVKPWFFDALRQTYPHLLEQYEKLYKTPYAPPWYRRQIIAKATAMVRSLGVNIESVPSTQPVARTREPQSRQLTLPL
ncbi:radical SAM protein [Alicyclobacillus hesperidum subsp. aegles]|uniref:SPL family radical SAM protein n=1 Tax=Alicyclobacillus hesperidum TaxID=89784 RepID=UPI00222D7CD4|nr:radical SAM protein [Alicyclobacillus hesperidum]GLG00479.1 radical SAM protein [Alicyclobacillus hesperidum subsp. aegles]